MRQFYSFKKLKSKLVFIVAGKIVRKKGDFYVYIMFFFLVMFLTELQV